MERKQALKMLSIPKDVFDGIVRCVSDAPHGCETGVTLFGTSLKEVPDSHYIVLAIAGPGKKATHEPAHYSGDENHSNEIYDALRSALPGIRWLGELHVHPRGMTRLSCGDLRTVRRILTGTDETLHPDEFIAGVMQQRDEAVDVYPVHFSREKLDGRPMEIQIIGPDVAEVREARLYAIEKQKEQGHDRPNICAEPQRSRPALSQAPRFGWLRKWWKRDRAHGRARGGRQTYDH